jgi:hypothetical protein
MSSEWSTINGTPDTCAQRASTPHRLACREGGLSTMKVDIKLPGKGDSNSHSARPVHQTISMTKWIWTSRLILKSSLSGLPNHWKSCHSTFLNQKQEGSTFYQIVKISVARFFAYCFDRTSVTDPGSLPKASSASLLIDHVWRGWSSMKKKTLL